MAAGGHAEIAGAGFLPGWWPPRHFANEAGQQLFINQAQLCALSALVFLFGRTAFTSLTQLGRMSALWETRMEP